MNIVKKIYHSCKALPPINFTPLNNRKGQTLVEFMLVLATILLMSMVLLQTTNTNIASRWKMYVEKIINPPGTPTNDIVTVELR